jgi:DNA modification methylase
MTTSAPIVDCRTDAAAGGHSLNPVVVPPYYQDRLGCIYHADNRTLLPRLPKGTTISDPPYNVGYHYDAHEDNLSVEEYEQLLRETIIEPCVVIHYAEALCALSWILEELPTKIVAWVYPSNTARQWRGVAWWGCAPDFRKDCQDYRNPNDKRIAERIARGERARLYDWWEINQVKNVSEEKTAHPCQIPLELMSRIIKITTPELVIDPYAGSGTTLLAAKLAGTPYIGIETSEQYCEIAAKRLSSAETLL